MKKYLVRLNDRANVEWLKDHLLNLGARNVSLEWDGALVVESPVPLNLVATDGVESWEEVLEVDNFVVVQA